MKAFMYRAALLCVACGEARCEELTGAGLAPATPANESSFDSDDFPKGPYGDGGGEADCPQACDRCMAFLENPLTADGVAYVVEAVVAYHSAGGIMGRGKIEVISEWLDFYGPSWPAIAGAVGAAGGEA